MIQASFPNSPRREEPSVDSPFMSSKFTDLTDRPDSYIIILSSSAPCRSSYQSLSLPPSSCPDEGGLSLFTNVSIHHLYTDRMSSTPYSTPSSSPPSMSCVLSFLDSNCRSANNRSRYHHPGSSTYGGVLSYPARVVEKLQSMGLEVRPWVVELTDELEKLQKHGLGVRDESQHDRHTRDESWRYAKRRADTPRRSCSASRSSYHRVGSLDDERSSRPYGYPAPPKPIFPRKRSHSPLIRRRSGYPPSTRGREDNSCSLSREQIPEVLPRRDHSLRDRFEESSKSHELRPERTLRRQKGQTIAMPTPTLLPSFPSMAPLRPVPSRVYCTAPYLTSTKIQSAGLIVSPYQTSTYPVMIPASPPRNSSRKPRNYARRDPDPASPVSSAEQTIAPYPEHLKSPRQPSQRFDIDTDTDHDIDVLRQASTISFNSKRPQDPRLAIPLPSCSRKHRRGRTRVKTVEFKFEEGQTTYETIDPEKLPVDMPTEWQGLEEYLFINPDGLDRWQRSRKHARQRQRDAAHEARWFHDQLTQKVHWFDSLLASLFE
jgi:hypothetical protein